MTEYEFLACRFHDRSSVVGRNRKAREHVLLFRRDISLPCAEQDHVSLSHEEAVAGIDGSRGVVRTGPFRSIVEVDEGKFVAAIRSVVQDAPIAFAEVGRFQQTEIHPVFHSTRGVSGRIAEIDDFGIEPIGWINFAKGAAYDLLVSSGTTE